MPVVHRETHAREIRGVAWYNISVLLGEGEIIVKKVLLRIFVDIMS